MSTVSFSAIELGVHSAACGLFLLLAGLAWRDGRQTVSGLVTAALTVSAAASCMNAVPGFHQTGVLWRAPVLALSAGGSAVFWLWVRVVFDDEFVPRARHALPWVLLVVSVLLSAYGDAIREGVAHVAEALVQLATLLLAALALFSTTATWRIDLVQGRRRLRVVILLGAVLFTAIDAVYDLGVLAATPAAIATIKAIGQITLAVLTAWMVLQIAPIGPVAAVLPPDGVASAPEPKPLPQGVNPVLLKRLGQVMTEERIFRQERLTIGALASRLAVPEERLRRAINEGLGYRNFNAFINHYRLEDAKSALSDPSQTDVPVLTIAMDAGFQSLGPFNRAFKADTGMTPTEYRRKAQDAAG